MVTYTQVNMAETSTNSQNGGEKAQNESKGTKKVGVYLSPITKEEYEEWKELTELL